MRRGNGEEDAPLEWRAPSTSLSEIKKLTSSQAVADQADWKAFGVKP